MVTAACRSLNDAVGPWRSSFIKILGHPSIIPRLISLNKGCSTFSKYDNRVGDCEQEEVRDIAKGRKPAPTIAQGDFSKWHHNRILLPAIDYCSGGNLRKSENMEQCGCNPRQRTTKVIIIRFLG